jgi:hypothetical protein
MLDDLTAKEKFERRSRLGRTVDCVQVCAGLYRLSGGGGRSLVLP